MRWPAGWKKLSLRSAKGKEKVGSVSQEVTGHASNRVRNAAESKEKRSCSEITLVGEKKESRKRRKGNIFTFYAVVINEHRSCYFVFVYFCSRLLLIVYFITCMK